MAFDAGSIVATLDVDRDPFDRKLAEAQAKADRFESGRATLRVDADTSQATAKVAALDAEVQKLDRDSGRASRSMGGFGSGVSGVGVAIAGVLPALPALAGGVLAVGGAFATAGTSAVAGAAVLATGVTQAVQANKQLEAAQKAVDEATTKSGRNKALAEQVALIAQLGPATIAFGQALHDVAQVWTSFAGVFVPQEVQLVAGFERLERDVLPALRPLVSSTLGVFSDEVAKLDAAVNSPSGQSFFSWLAVEGPRDLEKMLDGLGNFGGGLGHLLQASTPLIQQFADGFERVGKSFNTWSQGLDGNTGFQSFLATVAKDGPLLVHTLSDVVSAVGHIAGALSPVLPLELKFIDGIATLISDHPAIAAALGDMFLGFQALKIVGSLTRPLQLIGGALGLVGVGARGAAGEVVGLGSKLSLLAGMGPITIPIVLGVTVREILDTASSAAKKSSNPITHFGGDILRMLESGGNFFGSEFLGNAADAGSLFTSPPTDLTGAGFIQSVNAATGPVVLPSRASDYSQQVPGTDVSVYDNTTWNPTKAYYSQFLAGLNNPSAMLPLSGGGGGGASGPSYAQTLQAMFALQGVNLGSAFLQGIQTGVSPIDSLMTSLKDDIGSKAQPIADQFKNIFDQALQYGQQASASLIPNIVSGLPAMGSYTSYYMDASGHQTVTQGSPLLGGLQLTLANDQRFVADVDKARKLGLSQTLLSQFVQAGPSSLDQLDALVNGSPGDIKAINATFGQLTSLGNTFGAQQATHQDVMRTNDLLSQLLSVLAQQIPADMRKAAANAGQIFGAQINGTARVAMQNAQATPGLGPYTSR